MSWSKDVQDRWFFYVLGASSLSMVWLVWPYLDVLLFALVTATVSWPLQDALSERMASVGLLRSTLGRVGGIPLWSALLVSLFVFLVVFAPLTAILLSFVRQAIGVVQMGAEWVSSGRLDALLADARKDVQAMLDGFAPIQGMLPEDTDPVSMVAGPLREGVSSGLGALSNVLPRLLGGVATGIIDAILFVFTVVTLLAEGPRLLGFFYRLSPLDDRYEARLVGVFREFAINMVIGSFATAAAQGVAASLGFWFFGVPNALFFGVLTAIGSFVPVIGTGIIVVPAVLYVGAQVGTYEALGLLVYAVVVIGSVDNLLRPLFMRGSSAIHPLLIFIAVFGGMAWMGVTGVLVGPVLVAFFLALNRIHDEEFGQAADGGGQTGGGAGEAATPPMD